MPSQKRSFFSALLFGLRKYVKCHARIVSRIYENMLLHSDGRIFCAFFNLKALAKETDVKFEFDSASRKYTAKSSDFSLKFYHKKQANYAYGNGIRSRAETIGKIYFLHLVNFHDGDVVVDCGANVGDLKLYFDNSGIPVQYIGIEPSPLEYECLVENVSPSRTYNLGLWNTDGSLKFYLESQGANSSFIEPPFFDEVIEIPTKRMDDLIDLDIKLLKIVAEGAEPEAIEGCQNVLHKIHYISADLGFERGKSQSSTLVPVTNYLLSYGFELIEVSHRRICALYRNRKLDGDG